MMIEKDLRKIVTRNWDGWIDWLEPRGAAGIGRPDADLMVDGRILPVELKIGRITEVEGYCVWVRPSKIRPDQISWAHRFKSAGGVSIWLFADEMEGHQHIFAAWNIIGQRDNYKQFKFEQFAHIGQKGATASFSDQIKNFAWSIRCAEVSG